MFNETRTQHTRFPITVKTQAGTCAVRRSCNGYNYILNNYISSSTYSDFCMSSWAPEMEVYDEPILFNRGLLVAYNFGIEMHNQEEMKEAVIKSGQSS